MKIDIIGMIPVLGIIHLLEIIKKVIFGKEKKDSYRSKVDVKESKVKVRENKIPRKDDNE